MVSEIMALGLPVPTFSVDDCFRREVEILQMTGSMVCYQVVGDTEADVILLSPGDVYYIGRFAEDSFV